MSSRRIAVRRSGVHGKGVFAVEPIAAGERLIEYKGERITWKEALRRHPHNPAEPNHTFYFALDSGKEVKVTMPNQMRAAEQEIGWDDRVSLTWHANSPVVLLS